MQWHCLRRGRRPGPALRLPRPRPLRPAAGLRFNPAKLLLDPYAVAIDGHRRLARPDAAALRPRRRGRRPRRATRPTARRRCPSRVVVDRALRLGGRRAAAPPVERDRHLRGPRPRAHDAPPRRPRGAARHLRRPGLPGRSSSTSRPRRHGDRAAARPPLRRRELPRRPRADQLLGLQLDRLPRTARPVRAGRHARRAGARVQGHGQGAARRRARGDPRRRLQPHRRGQPPRPDARRSRASTTLAYYRQHRGPALLPGLHRHGQQPGPDPPAGPAADHGLAALLRRRVPRRRLPLRPRRRAGPRAARGRPAVGLPGHDPPGPGALAGQADRRAVGRRPRRLPGRRLPGAVERVERRVPRRHPRLLARRAAARRRSRSASPAPPTSTPTTAATRARRSTSSPPTTASRCATSSPTTTSTTRPTRRTTRTARTTTAPGTAASRARPTTPRCSRCAPASSATCSRR